MFDITTAVVDEEDKKQGFDISTAVIEDLDIVQPPLPPLVSSQKTVGIEKPSPIAPISYTAPDFSIQPIVPLQRYEMVPKLPEEQYTASQAQKEEFYSITPVTGIPSEREMASTTDVLGVSKVESTEISPQYSKITNKIYKMVSSKETNPKQYADILKDVPDPDREKIIRLIPPEIQDSTRKTALEFAGAAPATGEALKTAAAATGSVGKLAYPVVDPYNDKYFQNKFGREIIGMDKVTQEPATPKALKALSDKYRLEDGTISMEMAKDESPAVKSFIDAAKRFEENPNKQKPFVEAKENLLTIADILDPWEMKEYKITERIAQLKKKGGNEYGKAFERGELSFVISQAIADAAIANNPEQAQQAIALRTQYNNVAGRSPEEKKGILKELTLATVEMIAPMLVTGVKGSVPIVGQLWSGYEWSRQGMGDTYADMIEAGVSHNNARKIAAVGGVIYAQIENMEIAQLKRLVGKEAMSKSIRSMILNIVKEKGVDWAKEVGEEGFQRLTTDIATEIGKGTIEGAPKEELIKKVGRLLTNMGQEMAAAAGPMGVLTLFGIGGNLVKQAAQREEKITTQLSGEIDRINREGAVVRETQRKKDLYTKFKSLSEEEQDALLSTLSEEEKNALVPDPSSAEDNASPREIILPPDITIENIVNKIDNGENIVIDQPTKGVQDAEQVQGDQEQPDIAGDVREVSEDQGGEDIQQPEATRGAKTEQQAQGEVSRDDTDIVDVFKKSFEADGEEGSDTKATEEVAKLSEPTKKIIREHIAEISSIKETSQVDGLTGLKNRLWAKDQGLTREIVGDKGKKVDIPADIPQVHIDIDHFKKVNDKFGHQTGDEVLNQFGIILNEEFEKVGTPTRWGGEEFVTFPLTGIDKKVILDSIERSRKRLLESTFDDGRLTNINISAGFGESYKEADDALYIAKKTRGRTVDYAAQEQVEPDTAGESRVRVESYVKESDTPAKEQKPAEKEAEVEQPGPTDEVDIENHPDPEVRFSGKEGSPGKTIEGWLKPSPNSVLPNTSTLVRGKTGDLTDGHLLFTAGNIPPSYQKRFEALWTKKKSSGKRDEIRENVDTSVVVPECEGILLQHRKNIQFGKKSCSAYSTPDGRTVALPTETVSYLNKEFPGHELKSTGDSGSRKLEIRPVKIYNKDGKFVGIVMPFRFEESFEGINWDYKKPDKPAAAEKKAAVQRRKVQKKQPFPHKKRDYSIKEIKAREDGTFEFTLNTLTGEDKKEVTETGSIAGFEEKYGIEVSETVLPKEKVKRKPIPPKEEMSYEEAGEHALSLPETINIDTPERIALRQEIADKIYGDGAKQKDHKAVIIIGLPASGKSTIADKSFDTENYLLIDADEVKKLLPEYDDGLGANAVHEESSHILEDLILPKAITAGDNIILPVLGKTKKTLFGKIDNLKSKGYDVKVIHVKVPAALSKKRLEDRWNKTHRWVPMDGLESKQQKIESNAKELSNREDIEYEEWEGETGTRTDAGAKTDGVRGPDGGTGLQKVPEVNVEDTEQAKEEGGIDVSIDTGDDRGAVVGSTAGIRAGDEAEGKMGEPDRTGDNIGIPTDEVTDGQRSEDAAGPGGGAGVSGYISSAADGGGAGARGDEPANTALPGSKSERRFIDYLIDSADDIGQGGPAQKLKDNLEAIRTLKAIEKEGRYATPAEQRILVKYVGWGGLSNVFKSSDKTYQILKDLLTKEEYQTAIHSTLNAHYTSPMVIQNVWNAVLRLGFNGGNVLEPGMGIGHFFGLRPTTTKMAMSGIELDSITGRIAKQLYQNAIIKVQGYETHKMPKDYYNLIISNVPFLEEKYSPTETPAAKTPGINKRYALHDFYFLKSLYGLRPGGIIAFVTSRYTMDKQDQEIRKLITNQANFLGAIRLPSSAFKNNAGTEVVTDVIFLQKRFPNGEQSPLNESFVNVGSVPFARVKDEYAKEILIAKAGEENPIAVSQYFIDNPQMVLGDQGLVGTMYRPNEYGVVLKPEITPDQFKKMMEETIAFLPEGVVTGIGEIEKQLKIEEDIKALGDVAELDPNSYYVQGDKVLQKNEYGMEPEEVPAAKRGKVTSYVKIRDTMQQLYALKRRTPDADATQLLSALNSEYDNFVKNYGALNDKANNNLTDDPSIYKVRALEIYDQATKSAKKADVLSGVVFETDRPMGKAESIEDAYIQSLNKYGSIDVGFVARQMDIDNNAAADLLISKGLAYQSAEEFLNGGKTYYISKEEYLSGNVRKKHQNAVKAQKKDRRFEINVRSLEAVIPADLPPENILLQLSNPVLSIDDVKEFIQVLLNPNRLSVMHNPFNGKWDIKVKTYNYDAINRDYGIESYDAIKILGDILSGNDPMVYGTTYDAAGNPTKVFLETETAAARVKSKAIKDRFDEWIWSDEDRTKRLVRNFNDRFNAFVDRNYIHPKRLLNPDADIRFINSAFPYPAHKHQSDAVWRQTQSKNVMLAHEVGSGKTLEMIWASQECKRLGLIKKPIFVFPNHMVGQWASEFYQAYPDADLLVAREKDVSANKRQLFINKVATNNYDAVLIKLQDFGSIKLSPEEEADQLQYVIENFQQYLNDMDSGGKQERSVKDMQKKLDGFRNRIADLKAKSKKDKNTLYFDDMGIDMLFVDEADLFKNLMYYTTLQKVKGLGTAAGSGRAMDLSMKIRYIQRKGGRVVFATGTPISNTLVEAYTMMKYLQPEWLHEEGIESFDDWHKMFARTNTDMELDNTGSSYRPTSRFSKITNIPALMSAIRQVWDIKTGSMLERMKILVPGKNIPYKVIENISAPLTDLMKSFKRYMVRRENDIKKQGKPEKGMDNILTLINDGMKAAVDLRLFNSSLPDLPDSKLNLVVNNVVKIYKQYAKQRYTQVLFLENPRSYKKVNGVKTLDFDAYEDIRAKLIKGGVNPDEIADIRDKKYSTSEAKLNLYNDLRAGRKRILLGSVKKMGAGTNIQTLGKAIHQIDAKWKPRDFDQSNGRFVRQGNTVQDWDGDNIITKGKIGTVTIYNYVTKGSLDSGLWAMLETKAKVIKAIMENEGGIFEVEEDYFGSAKELSIEDPIMKEAMTLRNRVKELNGMRKAWVMNKNRLEQDIKGIPARTKQINTSIAKAEKDIATRTEEKKGDAFEITLAKSVEEPGTFITFKKEEKKKGEEKKEKEKTPRQLAGEHIISLVRNGWEKTNKRASIGKYAGFSLYLDPHQNVKYNTTAMGTSLYGIEVVGGYKYSSSTSMDTPNPAAMLTYLHKAIYEHPENYVKGYKAEIKALELSLGEAKKRVDKPFVEQEELNAAEERIKEVDKILSSRKDETVDPADEPVDWNSLRIELGMDLSGKSEEISDEDAEGGEGESPDVDVLNARELMDGGPQLFTTSLDDLKKKISPELWDVFDVTVSHKYGKGGRYLFDATPGLNKVNGSVWYDENGFHVVLNPKADPKQLSKTLVHEVMGHVGATNVLLQNKGIHTRLRQLFLQSQNTPLVRKIRTSYKENLEQRPDRAEDIVFSEWIAHSMASYIEDPKQQGIAKQVWLAIRKFLIDLGFLPHNINDMMYAMAQDMKTLTGVRLKLAAALEVQNGARLSKTVVGEQWYSPTLKAVTGLKQVKGTGDQMFSMIIKTPGVKEAEWKWMGLDDFLKGKQSVTKAEIESFVRQNQVEIKEVKKGEDYSDVEVWWNDEGGANEETPFSELSDLEKSEAKDRYRDEVGDYKEDATKFSKFTLPGGENYREVLLTLPEVSVSETASFNEYLKRNNVDLKNLPDWAKDQIFNDYQKKVKEKGSPQPFKSSHWDEPNVIAHIRTNDRTGPNGEKILFVEEIQSDWAREAREKGAGELTEFPEGYTTRYRDSDKKIVLFKNNEIVDSFKDYDAALQYLNKNRKPAQPFLKNWEELTLKRVLRMAAEEKYDRVAWINGEQTADRYDLSKKIDAIEYDAGNDDTYDIEVYGKTGGSIISEEDISIDRVKDLLGKDIADKIQKGVGEKTNSSAYRNWKKISGLDLKIGGEWAQNLYDRIIPNFLNKYGKKWGARVERIDINSGQTGYEWAIVDATDEGDEQVLNQFKTEQEAIDALDNFQGGVKVKHITTEIMNQQSIPITEGMRQSVLLEGQPMFSKEMSEEEEKSLLESEGDEGYYEDQGRYLESIYNKVSRPEYNVSKSYRKTKDSIIADILTPITTRLKNLSPNVVTTAYGQVGSFKEAMKRFEFDWMKSQQNDMKQVQQFLDGVAKMDPADQKILDMALKNADDKKVAELVEKYNLQKEYGIVRNTLDDIHRRALDAGFNLKYIKEYWPKHVLNYGGLIEYAAGTVEGGVLLKQMAKAENVLKRPLTDKEKADIINTFIARPDRIINIPGATKKRTIKFINTEMDRFYDFSTSALVGYIHDMNQQIGVRKFLGMDKEAQAAESLKESRMMTVEDMAAQVDDVVSNKISDITGGIDTFVLAALNENKLDPKQQDELIGLFRARFNYRPAGNVIQTVKDVGVISAMGSGFNSFITQLMDFAGSYYTAGPKYATRALWQVLNKENQISLKNIGIDRIAEEFRTQRGLSKYVELIFNKTFLTLFDKIGKETLGTAVFLRNRSLAEKRDPEFLRFVTAIFEGKSQQVIDDLVAGNITDDVQYLSFSKILDFQPVTLSEMPMMYLKSPVSRVFYSLKTYTIKFMDTMRSEGLDLITQGVRTGNRSLVERGLRNLAMLVALYSLAGAGTDVLKDWLFGRAVTFKDSVIDNMLKLIGISRYIAWEARKDGISMALTKLVLPAAVNVIEAPMRDIWALKKKDEKPLGEKMRDLETLGMVPFVGKHYYWRYGGGRQKEVKRQGKRLGSDYDNFTTMANDVERIRKYYETLSGTERSKYRDKHVTELALTNKNKEGANGQMTTTINKWQADIKKMKDRYTSALERGDMEAAETEKRNIKIKAAELQSRLKRRLAETY